MNWPVRSVYEASSSQIASGEGWCVYSDKTQWWDYGAGSPASRPAIIFCHEYGGSTAEDIMYAGYQKLFRALARDYLVLVADHGGQTWGNSTGRSRMTAAYNWLDTNWNIPTKIGIIGTSMGGGLGLAWAKANPTKVAWFAGIEPMLDLRWIAEGVMESGSSPTDWVASDPTGYQPIRDNCNAAFGGDYFSATHGPDASPNYFVPYLSTSIALGLWFASPVGNDVISPVSMGNYFKANRETYTASHPSMTTLYDLGAVGHSLAAVDAATPELLKFARANLDLI